jgi:hypothetical protein
MKGFLQRMAANAVRPQGGIHPLVGSIYAGPTTRSPRDVVTETGVLEEERLVTGPQSPPDEIEDLPVDPDSSPSGIRGKGDKTQRGGVRQGEDSPHQGRPTSFRPLMGEADVQSAGRGSYGTAADTESSDRSGAIFDREGNTSLRTRDLKSESVLPGGSLSSFAIDSAQRARFDAFPRSAPVEREGDKVEIHIGRIEVTAVPPEAPRPAAARPRKSLDLGEYLKRRDGRTG